MPFWRPLKWEFCCYQALSIADTSQGKQFIKTEEKQTWSMPEMIFLAAPGPREISLHVRSLCRIESTWLVNLSVIMRALFSQTLPSFARHFNQYSSLPCVFTSPSLTPSPLAPFLWAQLGASSLRVAAGFGCAQRGRPGATEGTEDRCGLHNDLQISYLSGPNPASFPPYISLWLTRPTVPGFSVPCQAREAQGTSLLPATG